MIKLISTCVVAAIGVMMWSTACYASYCELIAHDMGNEMSWNGITDVCNVPDRVCVVINSDNPSCNEYIEVCFVADEGISFTDYSCVYHADGSPDPDNPNHFTTTIIKWMLMSRVGNPYHAAWCHPTYPCRYDCPTVTDWAQANNLINSFNPNGGVWIRREFTCGPSCSGEIL